MRKGRIGFDENKGDIIILFYFFFTFLSFELNYINNPTLE